MSINVTRHEAINCIVLIYELYSFDELTSIQIEESINSSLDMCFSTLASPSAVKLEIFDGRGPNLYSVNIADMKLCAMILRFCQDKESLG